MRALYALLLRLHPARFRRRFAIEMLESFDEVVRSGIMSPLRLVADAGVSLARQWASRPATGEQPAPAVVATDGVPVFHQFADYHLRRIAVIEGFALSLGLFSVLVLLLGRGAVIPAGWSIGTRDPRPSLLTVNHDSWGATLAATEVGVPMRRPTALAAFAEGYFLALPILSALDANGDYALSPEEIDAAPRVLRALDPNHDGELSAAELGFNPPRLPPLLTEQFRRDFMHQNPVLRVLDADSNLTISSGEIDSAASRLRQLDVSGDGRLGTVELVPDEIVWNTLVGLQR